MSEKVKRHRSKSVPKLFEDCCEFVRDDTICRLRSHTDGVDDWNPFPDYILKRRVIRADDQLERPELEENEREGNLSIEQSESIIEQPTEKKKSKYFQRKNTSSRRNSHIANDIINKCSVVKFGIGSQPLRRSVSIDRGASIEEEPVSGSQSDLSIDFSETPSTEENSPTHRPAATNDIDEVATPTGDKRRAFAAGPDFVMRSFSATFTPAIPEEDSATSNQTDVNKRVVTSISASNLRESCGAASSESSSVEYQKNMIINELFLTEKSYCDNLQTLVRLIMDTFYKSGQFSSKDFSSIFPQPLARIYEIHSKFLQRLEVWSLRNSTGQIRNANKHPSTTTTPIQDVPTRRPGDPISLLFDMLLDNTAEILNLYARYLIDFPTAVETLNKLTKGSAKVRKIIRDLRKDPHCNGLEPSAFLLTPVQRLPRYLLLTNQMLRHCDANSQSALLLSRLKKTLEKFLENVDDSLQTALKTPQQKKKRRLRTLFAGSMDSLHLAGTIPQSQIYSPSQEVIGNTSDNSTVTRSGVLGKLKTRQRIHTSNQNQQAPRRNSVIITMPSPSSQIGSTTPNLPVSNGHYWHQMSLLRSAGVPQNSSFSSPAVPKQRPNSICQVSSGANSTRRPPMELSPAKPPVNNSVDKRPPNRRSSDLTSLYTNSEGLKKLTEETSSPRKYSMNTLDELRPMTDVVLDQIEENTESVCPESPIKVPIHSKTRSAPVEPMPTESHAPCSKSPSNNNDHSKSQTNKSETKTTQRQYSSSSTSSTSSSIDSQPSSPSHKATKVVLTGNINNNNNQKSKPPQSSSDSESESVSVTDSQISSSSSVSSCGTQPPTTTVPSKQKPTARSSNKKERRTTDSDHVMNKDKQLKVKVPPDNNTSQQNTKSQCTLSQLTEEIIKPGVIIPVSPKQRPQTKFMTSSAAGKSPVKKSQGREQIALHHRQSYMAAMEAGEDRRHENKLINSSFSPTRNNSSPRSSGASSSLTSASSQSSGMNSFSRAFSSDERSTSASFRHSNRESPTVNRTGSPAYPPTMLQRFKKTQSNSQANISVNSSTDSERISIRDTFRKVFQLRKKPDRRFRAEFIPPQSKIAESSPQHNKKGAPYSPVMS